MPVNGVASVTWLSSSPNGQQCANTVHMLNFSTPGAPPDPADLIVLAGDVDTFLTTKYRALLTTDSTLDAIKVAQVPNPSSPGDPYADYVLPKNVAGTRAGAGTPSPTQLCGVLSLKTNSGQRSYRGHLMLPPLLARDDLFGNIFNGSSPYYLAGIALATELNKGCGTSPTWTGTQLAHYRLSIYSRTLQIRGAGSVTGCILTKMNQQAHWLRSRARGTT